MGLLINLFFCSYVYVWASLLSTSGWLQICMWWLNVICHICWVFMLRMFWSCHCVVTIMVIGVCWTTFLGCLPWCGHMPIQWHCCLAWPNLCGGWWGWSLNLYLVCVSFGYHVCVMVWQMVKTSLFVWYVIYVHVHALGRGDTYLCGYHNICIFWSVVWWV